MEEVWRRYGGGLLFVILIGRIEAWRDMSNFGDCLARWARASKGTSTIEKKTPTRERACLGEELKAIKEKFMKFG